MEDSTLELLGEDVDYEYDLREDEEEKYLNLEEEEQTVRDHGLKNVNEDHVGAEHGENRYGYVAQDHGDDNVDQDAECEELNSSEQVAAVFEETEEEEEEEEEEEDAHGRGRFRSERSNIISLTSREPKTRDIPDSLDVVAVPSDSSRPKHNQIANQKPPLRPGPRPPAPHVVGIAPPISRQMGQQHRPFQRPPIQRRDAWPQHPQDVWVNGPPPTASIPPRKVLINPKYQGHVDVPNHGHALLLRNRAPSNAWAGTPGPRMASRPYNLTPTREPGPCFQQTPPPFSRPPPPVQGLPLPEGDGLLPLPLQVQESLLQTLAVLQQQQRPPPFTPHAFVAPPNVPPPAHPLNPPFYGGPEPPLRGLRQQQPNPALEENSLPPLMSCLVPRPPPQRSFQPPTKLAKPAPNFRLPPPSVIQSSEPLPKRKLPVASLVPKSPVKTASTPDTLIAKKKTDESSSNSSVTVSAASLKKEQCPSPDSSESVTQASAKTQKQEKGEDNLKPDPNISPEEAEYLRKVEEQKLLRQKILLEKAQKRRSAAIAKAAASQTTVAPPVQQSASITTSTAPSQDEAPSLTTSSAPLVAVAPVSSQASVNDESTSPTNGAGGRKKVKYKIRRWLNKDRQLIRMEKVLLEDHESLTQSNRNTTTSQPQNSTGTPKTLLRPPILSTAVAQPKTVKMLVKPQVAHAVQLMTTPKALVPTASLFVNTPGMKSAQAGAPLYRTSSCWLRIGALPEPLGQRLEIQIDPTHLEELVWVPGENVAVVEFTNAEAAVAFKERCERESLLGPSAKLCFVDI